MNIKIPSFFKRIKNAELQHLESRKRTLTADRHWVGAAHCLRVDGVEHPAADATGVHGDGANHEVTLRLVMNLLIFNLNQFFSQVKYSRQQQRSGGW